MTRPLLALAAPVALLLAVAGPPTAAAADACRLDATVVPGRSIELSGVGFPAAVDATIAVVRNDAAEGSIRTTTDAAGAFAASVDAGPGHGGRYSFTATAGGCSATATVVAVETAGGGTAGGGGTGGSGGTSSGGAGPTMPATDTADMLARPDGAGSPKGAALLLAFGALAVAGLLIAPRRRGRQR